MAIRIKQSRSRITDPQIALLEQELGSRLPDDYKQFLLNTNGGVPEPNEFDVPATSTGSGVNIFYGSLAKAHDGDLVYEQILLKDRLPDRLVAIADAEGGNRVCLSSRPEDFGVVFFWDHELESETDQSAPLSRLSSSFAELFSSLRPFDPKNIELKPRQIKKAWISPEFLQNIQKR